MYTLFYLYVFNALSFGPLSIVVVHRVVAALTSVRFREWASAFFFLFIPTPLAPFITLPSRRNCLRIGLCSSMTMNCTSLSLPWRCYSVDAIPIPESSQQSLLAISSFTPGTRSSKIQFARFGPDSDTTAALLECEQPLPITKVQWMPTGSEGGYKRNSILASSGLDLHLWRLDRSTGSSLSLAQHTTLSNKKNLASPPLTSFDWSKADPSVLVTCSIDTTCTVWNVSTQQIKTQLIAHDREVFDVAFSPSEADRFISVGADASMRLFDLRALEHSTILWEDSSSCPLLKCQWNQGDDYWVSCFGQDSSTVTIVDLRMPGKSWATLKQHLSDVTGVAWSPQAPNVLASADEDGVILIWDLTVSTAKPLLHRQMEGSIGHLKWVSDNIYVSVDNEVVALPV